MSNNGDKMNSNPKETKDINTINTIGCTDTGDNNRESDKDEGSKKIGVFICKCGGNISDFVDVERVRQAVSQEEGVDIAKVNMFSCSDSAQEEMIGKIRDSGLDAIVIASCSPKLHLQTFRGMAKRAGLNPYQYVQVNIREQCSWTHTHDREGATEKAIRLVRAGIKNAAMSRPLAPIEIETEPCVAVIGGGIGGMRAAISLAEMGLKVYLIEREARLGGMVRDKDALFPSFEDGQRLIQALSERINALSNITVFYNAEVVEKQGTVGKFLLTVEITGDRSSDDIKKERLTLKAGAIIVCTGAKSYTPSEDEFSYSHPRVITIEEYLGLLRQTKARGDGRLIVEGRPVTSIAYIYCVGVPKNECSRYCCSLGVFSAIRAKKLFKDISQYHLYREMRTYGSYEALYQRALSNNDIFIKCPKKSLPQLIPKGNAVTIITKDLLTHKEEIEIEADLVVLITGMVPAENNGLEDALKLPIGKNGFYNEIHPKLRPVETVIDGLFIAGCAQSPKNAKETVESALAASSKAASLLLGRKVALEPFVAEVIGDKCDGCGLCISSCPYEAITIDDDKGMAVVNEGLCKGEGACVPVCPNEAIQLRGFEHDKIKAMIRALIKMGE